MKFLKKHRVIAGSMIGLVVALFALAGCGSSSSSSSSSSASASSSTSAPASTSASASATASSSSAGSGTAKGTPIKTMTIASVNYNGPTYQNILETAKLYAKYVNAHGGINGHPLDALTCDEKGIPSGTSACARQAVAAGVVADVGSFSYNGATVVPIYQAAKTAWFGICCAIAPAEFKSPISFPLGNNPALNPGGVYKAAQDGCKNIGILELDLPTTPALNVLFTTAAKAGGYKGTLKFVKVPLTTTDYTPEVTQATTGTDCISMYLSESNISAVMPVYASTGAKQRLYGAQGNFDPIATKGFTSQVANGIVYGIYPDLSSPVFATYRAAIAQYKPPAALDYNSLGGLGTWTAFVAFTNIVKGMTGTVDHSTFLAAASKTSKVNTDGILPPIDFTKQFTGLGGNYLRAFNLNEVYLKNPTHPSQIGGFVNLQKAIGG